MAVTYQSKSTSAWSTATTVVITKPSGLASGDLMIANIYATGASVTTLSGWTLISGTTFWKYADSADAAASNFTWSLSGSVSSCGSMIRINGITYPTPILAFQASTDSNGSTSRNFTGLTLGVGNCLLIFFGQIDGIQTSSLYNIATSNPTWTEIEDSLGGANKQRCIAYANRPESTATGTFNLEASATPATDMRGFFLAIDGRTVVEVSDTVTETDSQQYGIGIFPSETISLLDTLRSLKGRLWTKVAKIASTWTRRNK